ncbi:unnamed protein product, partial [Larinioides sclopetarius]
MSIQPSSTQMLQISCFKHGLHVNATSRAFLKQTKIHVCLPYQSNLIQNNKRNRMEIIDEVNQISKKISFHYFLRLKGGAERGNGVNANGIKWPKLRMPSKNLS